MAGQAAPPRALRRATDIRRVLRRAIPRPTARATVYAIANEDGLRTAVVCGRKVGGAVERNRARRVLREAWREASGRAEGGFDVVLVAKPSIRGATAPDMARELAPALRSAGVVDDEPD